MWSVGAVTRNSWSDIAATRQACGKRRSQRVLGVRKKSPEGDAGVAVKYIESAGSSGCRLEVEAGAARCLQESLVRISEFPKISGRNIDSE